MTEEQFLVTCILAASIVLGLVGSIGLVGGYLEEIREEEEAEKDKEI